MGKVTHRMGNFPIVTSNSITPRNVSRRRDGVDYLVGDDEVLLETGKKPVKVFYVSAWLNPQRCSVPESSLTEDGYDYIVS